MITVISLAWLIVCLIEREARRNLAPQTKVDGLYNRQPARPTGAAHPGLCGSKTLLLASAWAFMLPAGIR